MRFGLIANLRRPGAKDAIHALARWARMGGHRLILCDDLRGVEDREQPLSPRVEIAHEVDIMISMGGDGTFLAAARAVGASGTPLLGINLGSLGFLTQLQLHQLAEALDGIVREEYQIEERMLLQARIEGRQKLDNPYALNDVVVDNGPIARLIDINLRVNGEALVTYKADGLILATPTGSTAYSLASGGPIVQPRMEAIIATPISSFSLNMRPVIFAPSDVLELSIHSEHGVAGLTLDGQVSAPLIDTDMVIITKADFRLKIVVFRESSFYQVLKRKLHWGVFPSGQD